MVHTDKDGNRCYRFGAQFDICKEFTVTPERILCIAAEAATIREFSTRLINEADVHCTLVKREYSLRTIQRRRAKAKAANA